MKLWTTNSLALTVVLCLSSMARADDDERPAGKSEDKKPLTAEQFVQKIAQCSTTDITLGKMAVQKATKPEVKKFAQTVVDECTKANKEIMALATQKRITPASQLDRKHQELVDKLTKASGAEFDRMYMEAQVKGYQEGIEQFEVQSKKGDDPEVKAFATKMLPTLREHLKMAKEVTGGARRDN